VTDGSFKKELVHHEKYATRAEAKASLFEYIEVFYNCERRHSALGYVAPAQFAFGLRPSGVGPLGAPTVSA